MKNYTIKELAELLEVSERTILRQIQTISDKENEDEFDYFEAFTTEEYMEFQKRINEYPVLKEYIESLKTELEFLRFNFAQQTETNKSLVQSLREKNFIEAKEKGLDKD